MSDDTTMSTTQAAEILGCDRNQLSYGCKKGLIPHTEVPGRGRTRRAYRIDRTTLGKLLTGEIDIPVLPSGHRYKSDAAQELERRIETLEEQILAAGKIMGRICNELEIPWNETP